MKTTFYLLGILLLSSKCELGETAYKFDIRNNTDYTVYYYEAFSEEHTYVYPDTIIREREFNFLSPSGKIRPKTALHLGGFSTIESEFKTLPKDTLSVYFFHPDTLAKYPWETIRKDYNILKRYDLSIEDMQLLDYEIVYPPTEAMEKMKMYPPYEE